MSYYFEVWLKGFAKDYLRGISDKDEEVYHPHVTLVRPFSLINDEKIVRKKIVDFCGNIKHPISFYLEGRNDFDGKYSHVPVFEDGALSRFDDGLEDLIRGDVELVKKIDAVKKFHATVSDEDVDFDCPRIDQYMLRLTGIRNERIWFSYDFVTGDVLDRGMSLDKGRWDYTLKKFGKMNV